MCTIIHKSCPNLNTIFDTTTAKCKASCNDNHEEYKIYYMQISRDKKSINSDFLLDNIN